MRYLGLMTLLFVAGATAQGADEKTLTVEPSVNNQAGYTPADWQDFYADTTKIEDEAEKALRQLDNPLPEYPPVSAVAAQQSAQSIYSNYSNSPTTAPAAVSPMPLEAQKTTPESQTVVTVIKPIAGVPQASAAVSPTPATQPNTVSDAKEENSENNGGVPARTFVLPHPTSSVNYESYYGDDAVLTPKEANQIAISDSWANGANASAMDVQGAVTFAFGLQQPSLVCAVFQVTDIELQAGEVVQSVIVGDSLRWGIDAMISGGNTPHIVVKPVDSGLATSMVVATDRRTYHFAMKSSRRNYMSRVMFTYPQEAAAKFEQQRKDAEAKAQAERERATIPETNEYLGDLNFNYRVTGNTPWKPTRVYNDGTKTIIEMPRLMKSTESPALLVKQGGEETLVNYRVQGDRYIVDVVFKEALLIAGQHGRKQQKITIAYLDYGKPNAKGVR